MVEVKQDHSGLSTDLVARGAALGAATLHEAGGKIGALPHTIRPVAPGMKVAGPAYPVAGPGGDNLWLHHAIYAAAPGDVLVISVDGLTGHGHWGEVMAVAAQQRGIAGLIIDGGVRDAEQLATRGFPTFSGGICIRGTKKDPRGAGSLGTPVAIGGISVHAGDLVVADADGVVIVPAERAAEVVAAGEAREAEEQEIFRRLAAGETTVDIYGLPGIPG
ncbi:4-carboxy-4-hydroxy-2-oxoadipate aldolase/oxaloacetate decarboxylase [Granulicoccus phenolivorans]|uniref:4-carboxy-4-hydroxy-2-oxoadipate aldolase/oxaloacetate decarboxylase n=1 Tax=Granulicoccus phenolivorans TaxID=266854 RepID=UPI0004006F10|nr:4-carboxy-4-hydroxy-2-oxoadipate aldolase/oxaloacetate decarboxylase [Granulicoccus phenolivorans]